MNNNNDLTNSSLYDSNEVNESTTSTIQSTDGDATTTTNTTSTLSTVGAILSTSVLTSSLILLPITPVDEETVTLDDTILSNTSAKNKTDDELHNQIIKLNENQKSAYSEEFIMQNETSEKFSDKNAADNSNLEMDRPLPPLPAPKRPSILINTLGQNNPNESGSGKASASDNVTRTTKVRRVCFPENDCDLVTGFLEPVDPWKFVKPVTVDELKNLYISTSYKHHTQPLDAILNHLKELGDYKLITPDQTTVLSPLRSLILNLKDNFLTHNACEALEDILKHIQYRLIDLTACGLDDISASTLFDMIEYYESTNELNISDNKGLSGRGWQSCISMIKRSKSLNVLIVRGTPLMDNSAKNLGSALNCSFIHTIKLENCGLCGKSISNLCIALKPNTVLKELALAHNDLSPKDGAELGLLLRTNYYIQFLDVSNNNLQDIGVEFIAEALIEQSEYFRNSSNRGHKTTTKLDLSIFSCNLNNINKNRNRFSPTPFAPNTSLKLSASTDDLKDNNKNNNSGKYENTMKDREIARDTNISLIDDSRSDRSTIIADVDGIKDLITFTDDVVDDDNNEEIIKDCSIIMNNNKNVLNENNCDINLSSTSSISSTTLSSLRTSTSSMSTTTETSTSDSNTISSSAAVSPLQLVDNLSLDESDIASDSTDHPIIQPVRSFSSESLNSETSVGSNDSKSSLKLIETKFTSTNKNGTLERQQSSQQMSKANLQQQFQQPRGLQVLILWNNSITRSSGDLFAQLIDKTQTLEILNIGRNCLSSDFLSTIKNSMKLNTSLTNIGFQGAHLSDAGAKVLSDILQFGGNSTLQRIDLRDNNIQTHGLIALNDALKSNKTITRIDLDDVPRRITESTMDNHTEYTRLLNNIRGHCSRNENPPEPPEPIRTSVDRVRANYINSRKISLTCHSVCSNNNNIMNNNILSTTTITNSPKDKHLDPSFKKSSGRLRSPLPSPAPSPIISPCPSPSRNRFQVSRVIENNNNNHIFGGGNTLSSSPSPSSTGSSPTFFPPNNSRFRVTTVNEPHKSRNTIQSSITPISFPKTSISMSTTSTTNNNSNKRDLYATPVNAINFSKTVTPSTPVSTTTNLTLSSYMHSISTPIIAATSTPMHAPQHQATSFDSPDLEVKRYMMHDSCCSSISSSIDSIDCMLHTDLGNASMSSTDSFDMIMKPVIIDSKSTSHNMKQGLHNKNNRNNNKNKTGLQSQQRINNSLSSLDMSTSSQESLNHFGCMDSESDSQSINMDINDVINVDTSDDNTHSIENIIDDENHLPSRIISSNEGTLTNSPCDETIKHISDDYNIIDIKNKDFVQPEKQPRVRKTSWIQPIINKCDNSDNNLSYLISPTTTTSVPTVTTSNNYPATLDKLLSLFQHPGSLFQRAPDPVLSKKESITTIKDDKEQNQPTRKESPMGGLFAWAQGNSCKKNTQVVEQQTPSPTLSPQQTQTTMLPEQTTIQSPIQITPPLQLNINVLQQSQQPVSATMSPESTVTNNSPNIELIPIDNLAITAKIKSELKENISPENTITSSTVSDIVNIKILKENVQEQQLSPNSRKVVFKVGDIDPDDDEDFDEIAEIMDEQSESSGATLRTNTRYNSGTASENINICNTEHSGLTLGQITRDSLSILKGNGGSSQDSMRSLDSLNEMSESMLTTILETPQQ